MALLVKRKRGSIFPSITDDLFESSFFSPSLMDINNELVNERMRIPLANISESKNEFKVDLSAPGLSKTDFKIEVEDGTLTISSEKKEESREDSKNYKRREFSYNAFSRSFALPENVQEDKINAKYDNGVLHVTIPKKNVAESKPKKAVEVE